MEEEFLDMSVIDDALDNLVALGLVESSLTAEGEKQYRITDVGIAYFQSLTEVKH